MEGGRFILAKIKFWEFDENCRQNQLFLPREKKKRPFFSRRRQNKQLEFVHTRSNTQHGPHTFEQSDKG